MKYSLLAILFILIFGTAFAQQPDEKEQVKKSINTLFEAMRKGDTVLLRSVLAKDMVLQSVAAGKEDVILLANNRLQGFLKAVGTPHTQMWDEQAVYKTIQIDDNLASVWAPYKFYLGGKFSHCGVDVIQLMKQKTGWKIIYLADNTRKDNCPD